MLKAFKEQIRTLAADPSDKFHAHIKQRMGKRATHLLEQKLKNFIFLTPGILGRVYSLWSHIKSPSSVKVLGGYLLTYMYSPKDFLPEKTKGLFGYLDDAYFAALVYERVVEEVEKGGLTISREDENFLAQLEPLKKVAKLVLAEESRQIENMLKEILDGNLERYNSAFS